MIAALALIFSLSAWAAPPQAGPLKPYKAPARQIFKLSTGVEVTLIEDRRLPLVTARLAVRGGSGNIPAREAGLLSALAKLMTEGTSKMTAKDIAEAADAIGGDVSVAADQDYIEVAGYSLAENADGLFSLMAQVGLEPSFPPAEVELRKKNMLEELKIDQGDPEFLASVAFHKRLYAGHPYGITAPTEASIARIDREKLRAVHQKFFVPENAFFVVAGDIGKDELKKSLEAHFGPWLMTGEFPNLPLPPPGAPAPGRRLILVPRPRSEQSVLLLGNIALTAKDPDYFPLLVANQILGGSFAARLTTDLREKKGYTYGIYSGLDEKRSAGAFLIDTQVRNEVTGAALRAVLGHMESLRSEGVSPEELKQAKNMLAGRFARGLEKQSGLADAVLSGLAYDLPADHLDTYLNKVAAVTAKDVRRAAQAYILPDRAVIIVVGDPEALKGQLEGFSPQPIETADVNGDVPAQRQ